MLGLPMIVNEKTVDPADKSSPAVYQLETAMGAAIGVFEGAQAIRVPRSRFVPVKKTSTCSCSAPTPTCSATVRGSRWPRGASARRWSMLDDDHFKLVRDFDAHFPAGAPSLREAERLIVEGDVTFGRDVAVRGSVTVSGPARVQDGTVLEG